MAVPGTDAPELVWARPAPALRHLVTGYAGYRQPASEPGTHQGVPSPHLTFLLCLDGAVDLLRMPDPARSPGSFDAMVAGLHDRPAVIGTGAAQTGLQMRLTWLGARVLLGTPAGALRGDVVDLGELVGRGSRTLLDRLASTPTWPQRFALLDAALLELAAWSRFTGPSPEVRRAWDLFMASGGTARVEDVARDVGWSRRHLATRFGEEIGLAPKAAARVIRFERACDLLRGRAGNRPSLADTAARCGYVDQAHLARDFRELAGITATRWLAQLPEA